MCWPLTLSHIFKVLRPWLRKSCPLCNVFSFRSVISIFATNNHYHSRVCHLSGLYQNSKILLAFFPYLAEIIISIRGCVASNDLWTWPIFSRSFGLDLESCPLCSVYSSGWIFSYLVQMINGMSRCVACDDLWTWPISSSSLDLDFENRVRAVTFSVLDRLFPYLPQIITTIRGCVVC